MKRGRVLWKVCAICAVCAVLLMPAYGAKPRRDINNVKKERQSTQREIKETSRQLSKKAKEAERELNKLSGLRNEINKSTKAIGVAQAGIDSLNTRIGAMSDTLSTLTSRRDSLSRAYVAALRGMQGHRGVQTHKVYARICPMECPSQKRDRHGVAPCGDA